MGIATGLIAGGHRWLIDIGGFTATACMVSTIVESAFAGLCSRIFYRMENKWLFALFLAAVAETAQMGIILIIAKPFSEAVELVKEIGIPMIFANGLGVGMFIAIIDSIFRERDRIAAKQAELTLRIANRTLRIFREGFDENTTCRSAEIIRSTLHVAAVAFTDTRKILCHVGMASDHHKSGESFHTALTGEVLEKGVYKIATCREEIGCDDPHCRLKSSITVPLQGLHRVFGTLKIYKARENDITSIDIELALGLAALFSTQIEVSKLENQNKLLAKAELLALQAQINPHFLFNAINTIANLTRTQPDKAHELLIHLGSFFRKNLSVQDELVPLSQEMEQVDSYLKIERARFGDKLEIIMDIPEDLDCLIPPLSLQPIVENAVKHGIQKKVEQGWVMIQARDEGNLVEITVRDNGCGITEKELAQLFQEQKESHSIGLININKRLVNLFGEDYALSLSSGQGEGTVVTLRIPKGVARVSYSSAHS